MYDYKLADLHVRDIEHTSPSHLIAPDVVVARPGFVRARLMLEYI